VSRWLYHRVDMRWLPTLSFAVLLSSCGATSTVPETGGDPPAPPHGWASLDHEQRQAWMMEEVLPRMSALFADYDAERYAGFGCASCHGPDARANGFAMPSPSLPALHPTGTPEQRQMAREYPEGVRFMFNRVLPTMQALVGAPDYDEASGEGFSCFSCHPHAGDPGTTPIRLATPDEASVAP